MLKQLITLLVIAIVLYVIYYAVSLITGGPILALTALILVLVFIWKALDLFGIGF